LTLGLFSLVVNALMVMLTDLIVPGISFGNFWSSLALALVVSLIQVILGRVFKRIELNRFDVQEAAGMTVVLMGHAC
jgi:uncharacterized membrane protein YvlD (DUF360 family)